jgi:uncharacterized membrane protein
MMKKFSLLAVAVAILPFTGCNTSPTGGHEGTKDSFTISGPSGTTDIKQGASKTEKVTLNRGKDFKQDVKLSTQDVPKDVTVEFDPAAIKAADKGESMMTIKAGKDAPLGEATFKVIAKPESGIEVPLGVKIKIEKP